MGKDSAEISKQIINLTVINENGDQSGIPGPGNKSNGQKNNTKKKLGTEMIKKFK